MKLYDQIETAPWRPWYLVLPSFHMFHRSMLIPWSGVCCESEVCEFLVSFFWLLVDEMKYSDGKKREDWSLVWLWICKHRVEDTTVHLLISKNDIHHRSLSPLQWFRGVFLLQDYHRQITSNTTGLDWDNAEVTFEKAANLQTTWGWKV